MRLLFRITPAPEAGWEVSKPLDPLEHLLEAMEALHQGSSFSVPNYSTRYSVKDTFSGVDIDSQETRLGDRTEGSYSTLLPDGRRQIVTYWVDGNSGYNAKVTYEGVAHHPQTTPLGYGRPVAGLGSLALGASGGPGYGVGGGVTFGGGSGLGLGGALGAGYRGSGVAYRSAAGRGYGGL
ncbi:Larval cuticle protein A3A [Amphibalanus amphitrite]|uniref:Larval cuticle protein A3A n=1 Tax=Amphibalanus amphitrite TaxID=1232801 RepID=A0A6A4X557_AMPAM|nr:Larval cuticle protein A3A [Amphibalanus amphitrite]